MTKNLIAASVVCLSSALAAESWTENFADASAKAAAQNRLVLAVFTGSDWCGPCKALKSKVFDINAFTAYAKDRFIPVVLDFPQKTTQTDALKKQNQELAEKYAVGGFPTALVLSPEGTIYGGFIGGITDIKEVTRILDQAIAAGKTYKEATEKAASLQGEEKANELIKAYNAIPEEFRSQHAQLAEEIMEVDTKDASGLKAQHERDILESKQLAECDTLLRDVVKKGPEAFCAKVDELLKNDYLPSVRLRLLQGKIQSLFSIAQDEQGIQKILAAFDQVSELRPEDKDAIEQMKSRIQENKDRIIEGNRSKK